MMAGWREPATSSVQRTNEGEGRGGEERFVERWNENTCEREKVREGKEGEEREREREEGWKVDGGRLCGGRVT